MSSLGQQQKVPQQIRQAASTDGLAYLRGWEAAIADSRAQMERMRLWREGERDFPAETETEYWKGLNELTGTQLEQFREGYQTRWKIEVELFSDLLFKREGEL